MVKKVKTFLNNAEIIEDENRLLDIANQCEPGKTSEEPSARIVAKRQEEMTRSRHREIISALYHTLPFLVFHFLEHTNQKINELGETRSRVEQHALIRPIISFDLSVCRRMIVLFWFVFH